MILGIETSGEMASLALVDGRQVVREDAFPSQMALCQQLMPRIEALLRKLGTVTDFSPGRTPRDRRCFEKSVTVPNSLAVSLGPGSFTSLRIGIATAKALAHAWEADIVGVPTAHAIADGLTEMPEGALVCAIAVARKGHLYVAFVERSAHGGWRDAEPCAVHATETLADALADVERPMVLCGEAATTHVAELRQRLGSRLRVARDDELLPTARHVAFVGAMELERRGADDLFSLKPIYAQPSQAEAARGIDLGL